jgi:hypothetical protein
MSDEFPGQGVLHVSSKAKYQTVKNFVKSEIKVFGNK